MAINRETAEVDVVTRLGSSINELGRLEAKLNQLNQQYRDLGRTTKKNRDEKQALRDEMTKTRQAVDAERAALGPLAMSLNQLERAQKQVRKEMAQLSPLSAEYKANLTGLIEKEKQYTAELEKRRRAIQPGKSWFQQIAGQMPAAVAGAVGGFSVGLAGTLIEKVSGGIGSAISKVAEFTKQLSSLSAITGVRDADTLRFYGDAAHYLGQQFGELAKDILYAFQIVGSVKPELLGMKEALVDVTEQALILSKASGGLLSVEDAARAVVGSLNQFDEQADQAARFANVLAAGAKEGSSEITQTAAAFKYAGAVLRANNLTFEQSNALVQVLASKMILGEQAGTNLRNIFSKLLTGAREFNPAIVGLHQALDNLAKLTPAAISKKFGDENVTAAMTLIRMRGEVERLTDKITGTNEAVEQQRTQMNNLAGDLDRLSTAWNSFFTAGGQESEGFFRNVTQGLTKLLTGFKTLFRYIEYNPTGGPKTVFGFSFDAARMERDDAEAYAKRQAKNRLTTANATVSDVIAEQKKYLSGDENQKTLEATQKTVLQMRRSYLDLQAEYARTTDGLQKQALRGLMQQAGANLVVAKREADRVVKNEKYRQALLVQRRQQEAEAEAEEAKKRATAGEKARREAEQRAKEELQLQFKLADTYTRLITDKQAREEQQAQLKYARALNEAREAGAHRHDLEVAAELELAADVDKIRKEYEQKRLERAEKQAQRLAELGLKTALFEAEQKRAALGEARTDEEAFANYSADLDILNARKAIDLAKLESDQRIAILKAEQAEKQAILDEFSAARAEKEQEYSAEAARLGTQYFSTLQKLGKQQSDAEEESKKKEKQLFLEKVQYITNAAQQFSTALFSIRSGGLQQQEQAEEKSKARSIQRLDDQKAQGLITEQGYQQARTRIEQQADEKIRQIKRRQAINERIGAVFSATIAGIRAVMEGFAQTGPFGGLVGAGIMAGVTAAQIAAILATPLPEYAEGNWTDQPFKSGRNYAPRRNGPGHYGIFNERGIEYVSPHWQAVQDPVTAPYVDWLAYRNEMGYRGTQGPPPPGAGSGAPVVVTDPHLTRALVRLNQHLDDGIRADISYREFRKQQEQVAGIYADALAPNKTT